MEGGAYFKIREVTYMKFQMTIINYNLIFSIIYSRTND